MVYYESERCGDMPKYISSFRNEKVLYNHQFFPSTESKHFDFHVHDICEMIFFKKGSVSAIIGNNIYKLHKDNIIIFKANIPHRIVVDDGADYERYDILFDESTLANGIFERMPSELVLIDCSGNEYITDIFKKLDFYCESFDRKDLDILIPNITEELIFNLYLSSASEPEGDIISMHPIVGKAVKYVNKHYSEDITIDDISDNIGITKSHLHHLFSEYMKITPKKYINIRRLAKAQKLIRTGGKPSVIYSSCGFGDYATFFRNYTEHFGYKPSEENRIVKERKIES